jgi:integrase
VGEIAAFRDDVSKRVRAATVNVYLKCIRTALQDAWREGLIVENPASKVDAIKRKDSFERRGFSLPELKALVETATGEWRGMILFGLYTGARLTDVAGLTWENVDLERNEIRFVATKTGRRQILPIAKPLRRLIEELDVTDNPKQPLFPACSAFSASALSKQFYGILESASLVPKRARAEGSGRDVRRDYSEISFHSLRHTATSLLKNAGVSDAVAREIIGHDTVAASRVYSHIEQCTLKKALDKMPSLVADLTPRKATRKKK